MKTKEEILKRIDEIEDELLCDVLDEEDEEANELLEIELVDLKYELRHPK